MKKLLFTLALSACLSQTWAGTYYVATTGSNANAGTSSGVPFKTITYALSVADSASVIYIAAGTYNVALGEVFPLTINNAISLIGSAGAVNTVINAIGSSTRVILSQPAGGASLLEGLTIKNGEMTGDANVSEEFSAYGGGIKHIGPGKLAVKRCIISENIIIGYPGDEISHPNGGHGYGGGFYGVDTVINCVIADNIARGGTGRGYGGGFSGVAGPGGNGGGAGGAYCGIVINCTFYNNSAQGGDGGTSNGSAADQAPGNGGDANTGGLYLPQASINNIFANNSASGGMQGSAAANNGTGSTGGLTCFGTLENNLFYSNTSTSGADHGTTGTNPVADSDPLFINTAANDFRIPGSSPAVNAGTTGTGVPSADFSNYARSGNPDIGAFETGSPALPVTLLSFIAQKISAEQAVLLTWTTANELNNRLFRIERSFEGKDFEAIAEIEGKGNSSVLQKYSWKDRLFNNSGTYYYRLAQVDFDGKITYSAIQFIQVNTVGKLTFSVMPNPATGPVQLNIDHKGEEAIHIRLSDIQGRKMYEGDSYSRAIVLNLEEYASGLYFIQLSSGNEIAVQKISIE